MLKAFWKIGLTLAFGFLVISPASAQGINRNPQIRSVIYGSNGSPGLFDIFADRVETELPVGMTLEPEYWSGALVIPGITAEQHKAACYQTGRQSFGSLEEFRETLSQLGLTLEEALVGIRCYNKVGSSDVFIGPYGLYAHLMHTGNSYFLFKVGTFIVKSTRPRLLAEMLLAPDLYSNPFETALSTFGALRHEEFFRESLFKETRKAVWILCRAIAGKPLWKSGYTGPLTEDLDVALPELIQMYNQYCYGDNLGRGYLRTIREMYGPVWGAALDGTSESEIIELLNAGESPNMPESAEITNGFFDTALHMSLRNGWLEAARALVLAGAKVDTLDKDAIPALVLAVRARADTSLIRSMLLAGADPERQDPATGFNAPDQKVTPFFAAVSSRQFDIADVLLEFGARPTYKIVDVVREYHENINERAEIIDYLLSHGATFSNTRYPNLITYATISGKLTPEIIEMALDRGAHLNDQGGGLCGGTILWSLQKFRCFGNFFTLTESDRAMLIRYGARAIPPQ